MNYILGDIGNTLTKVCLVNYKYKIIKEYSIETKKLFKEKNILNFFNSFLKKNIDKILFSSVVPDVYKKIEIFFKKKKIYCNEIKKLPLNKLIKINIDHYNQLGSDRIANAIGAVSQHRSNVIIIDFGTATTFDIVKKVGIYEGGVIAPGIKLSIINLSKNTAALPIFRLRKDAKVFGKNTKDALNAGFLFGYQGLINNIVKKISHKLNINFKIILTGGYANMFNKFLEKKSVVDKNITIKGIMFIHKKLVK